MHTHNPKTLTTPQILEFEQQKLLIGDYIGVESCLDLQKNDDFFIPSLPTLKNQRKCNNAMKKKKEFPPPIPSCRMPWVLKRYYTNDGRLILKEERVKHHEYFQAHRCNGRLTLQLVPLDFSDHEEDQDQEQEQELEVQENQEQENQEREEEEEENDDRVGYFNSCVENGISGNVNSPFSKCLNYNIIRPGSTCIFGVPVVPTMRPVHI